jgi:phage tail tape-measure protein
MAQENVVYTLSLKDLFTNKIKAATSSTDKLNNSVNKVQNTFNSIGGALGIGLGAAGVVAFGRSVIESLKNYEYFSASLRVLMHGDAEAAKALQSQLVTLAAKTPFSLNEIQDATKQLLAYGFSAGSVTKNISMLGDVASGLAIPFQDIAYLYGTLKTQGRAFSKDIYQFTGRGIPIVAELAKQFKVADKDVMKLVEDGKVGFKEVEKAFISMTSEGGQFFNMMNEQSATVGGKLSNMGDAWEQLKVNIGKSQSGIIAGTVDFANNLISSLNRGIAATNLLDEALSSSKTKGFSFAEKYLSNTGALFGGEGKGGFTDLQQYADEMNKALVQNAKTEIDVYNNIVKLSNIIGNMVNEGFTANEKYISVLRLLIDKNKGQLGLFKPTTGKETLSAGGDETTTKKSTGGVGSKLNDVESRRATNINVTIGNLIQTQEIHAQNLTESSAKIADEVKKALLTMLNDVNLIAG